MKTYLISLWVFLPALVWADPVHPRERDTSENRVDTTSVLQKVQKMDQIIIRPKGTGTSFSFLNPIQSQRISSAELQRAACCNLSEAFETNPSVDVSYSDAATGAKQIKLLGLSGSYVQMQTENVPGFKGVNAQYGLDYIPGPWMESIQISKGAASVKNGFESITGQINVEYKKSEHSDPLTLNLYGADNGRAEVNLDGTNRWSEHLSNGWFIHYSNDTRGHDENGDGFLDRPKTEQLNVMNRWNYRKGNWVSHWGARILTDTRNSGQDVMEGMSATPYKIGIKNRGVEFYGKQGYLMNRDDREQSMALIVSGSYTDYRAAFGNLGYEAIEKHLYASWLYETEFSVRHKISAGLSLQADLLGQQTPGFLPEQGSVPANDNYWVPGAYLEYTYKPVYNMTIIGGIRADHSNRHGWFVTPRFHLKYDPTEWLILRASAGKGYRNVNIMSEYNYMLASSRAQHWSVSDQLPMEEAVNYGASATVHTRLFDKELVISSELYSTRFLKQVVMDNETNPHAVSFYALQGKSYADNAQIEVSYPLFEGLDARAAYRYVNTQVTYQQVLKEKALQSRHKGLLTLSYKTDSPQKRWQFDYTLQLNGSGRLPSPDVLQPLWKNRFDPYTITHVQISKFFTWGSVYAGSENVFDFKQKDPIVGADDPFGASFDATMIWGPIHGRTLYVGLRYIMK